MSLINCDELVCHDCVVTIDIKYLKSRLVMSGCFEKLALHFEGLHEFLI